jgi:hypothetical protein
LNAVGFFERSICKTANSHHSYLVPQNRLLEFVYMRQAIEMNSDARRNTIDIGSGGNAQASIPEQRLLEQHP